MKTSSPIFFVLATMSGAGFAACPVTLPSGSPVDVPNSPSNSFYHWFGSDALAVSLKSDGIWLGMGATHRYRDKLWFWRRGYSADSEPVPALTLKSVRLHASGNPREFSIDRATNASGQGWSMMLVGMEFPSAGCWQVTATYVSMGIEQELTFVVDVVDVPTNST
jgi:hypothetical protein